MLSSPEVMHQVGRGSEKSTLQDILLGSFNQLKEERTSSGICSGMSKLYLLSSNADFSQSCMQRRCSLACCMTIVQEAMSPSRLGQVLTVVYGFDWSCLMKLDMVTNLPWGRWAWPALKYKITPMNSIHCVGVKVYFSLSTFRLRLLKSWKIWRLKLCTHVAISLWQASRPGVDKPLCFVFWDGPQSLPRHWWASSVLLRDQKGRTLYR